jgi:head-tail adaptor
MDEFTGRLSERVRFEGRDEVRGSAGDRVSAWVTRFERWALVEPIRRGDPTVDGGDTRHSARRWRVTIRDGVQPTLDMRLRWRNEVLRPTGIEIDDRVLRRIIILAEDHDGE